LPDFFATLYQNGKNIPNNHKYTKWLQNMQTGRKIYQHLTLQDPPKFTQMVIFGLKICHLATLVLVGQFVSGFFCFAFPPNFPLVEIETSG
jgi:hypothetical protein